MHTSFCRPLPQTNSIQTLICPQHIEQIASMGPKLCPMQSPYKIQIVQELSDRDFVPRSALFEQFITLTLWPWSWTFKF